MAVLQLVSVHIMIVLMLGRMGAKLRHVMDNLAYEGKQCIVISMMPLKQLSDRKTCTIPLMTTWNKVEPHITLVYDSLHQQLR